MPREIPPIAVIGGGTMASAVVHGCVAAGVARPDGFLVAEPDAAKRATFARGFADVAAAIAALRAAEPAPGAGVIMLAVKPQMLAGVGAEVAASLEADPSERACISILAGVTGERVREAIGGRGRVVRVMPNTPARAGRGMTAVAASAGATDGDAAMARALFDAVGEVVTLDEPLIDAFTGVAGSGPAYVFYLCEAMTRAGVAVGLDEKTAERCARQTIIGAAELLRGNAETGAPAMRAAVTSKGGTTQAAIESLDEDGVTASIVRAVAAARDRGRELGGP